jgi:hypothetical protein
MLGGHRIEDCKILPDGTVLGPDGTKIGFVEIEGAPEAAPPPAQSGAQPVQSGAPPAQPAAPPAQPAAVQVAAEPKRVGSKVKRPRKTSADMKERETWLDAIPPPNEADRNAGVSTPRFAKHQAEAAAVAAEAAAAAEAPPEPEPETLSYEEMELLQAEKELAEERERTKQQGEEEEEEEEEVAPPPKKGVLGMLGNTSLGLPLPGLGGDARQGVLILLGNSGVGKTRLVRVLEAGGTVHAQPEENKWADCTRTLLPTLGKVRLSSPKEHCDMITWDVPGGVASRPLVTFSMRGIAPRLKMMPHVLLMCAVAPNGRTPPPPHPTPHPPIPPPPPIPPTASSPQCQLPPPSSHHPASAHPPEPRDRYDPLDRNSFRALKRWHAMALDALGPPVNFVMVATRHVITHGDVSPSEARAWG